MKKKFKLAEFAMRIGNNPIKKKSEIKTAEEFIQLAIKAFSVTPFIYLIIDNIEHSLFIANSHRFYILEPFFDDYEQVIKKYDLPVYNVLNDKNIEIVEIRVSYQSKDAFEDYTVCRTTREIAKRVISERSNFLKIHKENIELKNSFDLEIRKQKFNEIDEKYKKELIKYKKLWEDIEEFSNKFINDHDDKVKFKTDEFFKECFNKFGYKSNSYNDFETQIPFFQKLDAEKLKELEKIQSGEYGYPKLKKYPFEENTPEYKISILSNREYVALRETELIK